MKNKCASSGKCLVPQCHANNKNNKNIARNNQKECLNHPVYLVTRL